MVKKKCLHYFIVLSSSIILVDQIIKYLIIHFRPNWNFKIGAIEFVSNTGAGFGILKGQTFLLGLFSLAVAAAIIFYYSKIPQEKKIQTFAALFLGGVAGNLIDRLFRGYVIDFINLNFWPAFNTADSAISIAVAGLIIYYWKK